MWRFGRPRGFWAPSSGMPRDPCANRDAGALQSDTCSRQAPWSSSEGEEGTRGGGAGGDHGWPDATSARLQPHIHVSGPPSLEHKALTD